MQTRRSGFTLIELLVVIAIIAILAAIMFPVLRDAKVAGQRSSCSSNLKQLGLAMKMYMDDSAGCFPATFAYNQPPARFSAWVLQIRKYLPKNNAAFACPGAAATHMVWINEPSTSPKEEINLGYGYNEFIFYSWYWDSFRPTSEKKGFARESAMRAPQQVILIADCYRNSLVNDWNDAQFLPDYEGFSSGFNRMRYADVLTRGTPPNQTETPRVRHSGPNIVFCDLHVMRMPIDQFRYQDLGTYKKEWPLVNPAATKYVR